MTGEIFRVRVTTVFWDLLICGFVGVLIGLRYRVLAILAASAFLAICLATGTILGLLEYAHPVLRILLTVALLQFGYLLGLAFTVAFERGWITRRESRHPSSG